MKTIITIYCTDNTQVWYKVIDYKITDNQISFETKDKYYTFMLDKIVGYSIKK